VTNQIAQTGLSSLPPVIYYSEQLFSVTKVSSYKKYISFLLPCEHLMATSFQLVYMLK